MWTAWPEAARPELSDDPPNVRFRPWEGPQNPCQSGPTCQILEIIIYLDAKVLGALGYWMTLPCAIVPYDRYWCTWYGPASVR